MARQQLKLKRITFKRPFKAFKKRFPKAADSLMARERAYIVRRAKSIMKPAPNTKTSQKRGLYGGYQWKNVKTYQRQREKWKSAGSRGASPSAVRFVKGVYSPPGKPPYYHGDKDHFNLRRIRAFPISKGGIEIPHSQVLAGGDTYAYRAGPLFRHNKRGTPIPQLHEYGGKIRLGKKAGNTYKTKNKNIRLRRQTQGQAVYPARPYMRPAGEEARTSARAKAPHSEKKIFGLGSPWRYNIRTRQIRSGDRTR